MAGVLFFNLIINAFFFSFIFWILTFFGKFFFSNKYYNYKLNFYECGFKNLTVKEVNYEVNYLLVALFLIIYDGEFLILLPFALNMGLTTLEVHLTIVFFILWLLVALVIDYSYEALEWQI